MFGKHRKSEEEQDVLQSKADEFDRQFAESLRRAQQNGTPELPPRRDYRGRPID